MFLVWWRWRELNPRLENLETKICYMFRWIWDLRHVVKIQQNLHARFQKISIKFQGSGK